MSETIYTGCTPVFLEPNRHCLLKCGAWARENVQVTDGRVTFTGGPSMIAAANLNLRTAERVLLLLKDGADRHF